MTTRNWIMLLIAASWTLRASAAEPVYRDNVVIVLDGSGSMKERMSSTAVTKMNAAKAALHAVLGNLPPTTHVGVLVFCDGVSDPWIRPLGPQSGEALREAIDSVRAGGGTPLGKFIKIGADRLLAQRAKQFGYGSYRLLVVTDGEASDGKLVDRYSVEVIARGVRIDVVGVDMESDHTLATKAHSYRRADDPEALQTAIAEVFAEVTTGDTQDGADGGAFEVIAPLPDEMAKQLVLALAASGNEPIGTRPIASRSQRGGPSGSGSPASQDSSRFGIVAAVTSCCSIGAIVGAVGVAAVFIIRSRRKR